jgi:RNA polymerase sigma factor (sigma-70 family)
LSETFRDNFLVESPEELTMTTNLSFDELMSRLRQGDNEAARQLFERFAQRLIALIRQQLDERLRGRIDPEDVMQSVFLSFFCRSQEEEFQLRDWDDLWALLTRMTLNKLGHHLSYHLAERRSVQRESEEPIPSADVSSWTIVAREPTPLEAMILSETVEELLRPLNSRDRTIAMLALEGYTRHEIAEQAGCTERTVYRVLARLRHQMKHATNAAG